MERRSRSARIHDEVAEHLAGEFPDRYYGVVDNSVRVPEEAEVLEDIQNFSKDLPKDPKKWS